jgi:hypothetical protein
MIQNNRIIFSDNSTLKDFSVKLNEFRSDSELMEVIAAEDKLYIGGDLPFNHRWFEIDTVNSNAVQVSKIELWDGDEWHEAVDIIDQTEGFKKSGHISWSLDKDEQWHRDDTRATDEKTTPITGLGNDTGAEAVTNPATIYNLYWMRITFDADMSAGTSVKFIGHKFADENDLSIRYPELVVASTKTQFESGKTDWKDQEFLAAEEIIRDLVSKSMIVTPDQILNWQKFRMAATHKLAEIIYRAFGDDYEDNRKVTREYYKEALDVEIGNFDTNSNAIIDPHERTVGQGTLTR